MSYHFQGSNLRVMLKFSRQKKNAGLLKRSRGVFVLHALPTSVEFISNLKDAGVEISQVYIKPYSIDEGSINALKSMSERLSTLNYDNYETKGINMIVEDLSIAIDKSIKDKKKIFCFDIGGYLLQPVKQVIESSDNSKHLVGIVEDTTYGHNKYLDSAASLNLPILSVARSQLKEIEARFVGRDAVVACDMVLREQGIMLSGRKALSIGYGMIGKNVANSLRSNDLVVSVYDQRDCRNLHAYMDGFDVNKKNVLLKRADIIFSQTAAQGVSYEEIEECKDGVILASVGSKNTEFDIAELRAQAIRTKSYGDHIDEYQLSNSKRVRVLHQGAAVNFLNPSLPVEVFDLVFSEVFLCIMFILNKDDNYLPGKVHEISASKQNEISREWLRAVNS